MSRISNIIKFIISWNGKQGKEEEQAAQDPRAYRKLKKFLEEVAFIDGRRRLRT